MKVTIKMIAEQLAVSPATVSLVLNNKRGVSKSVRGRVAAALTENGYTIRNADSNNGNKRKILFVSYKSTNWINNRKDDFLSRVLDGIERGAKNNNCSVSIANAAHDDLKFVFEDAERSDIDGIVFLGTEYAHFERKLFEEQTKPLVCIDRPFEHYMVNSIIVDNYTGMYQAITDLMEKGHSKIGFLACDYLSGSVEYREKSFYSVMESLNLPVKKDWILRLSFLKEEAKGEIDRYLKTHEDLPTAFLATNDVMAIAMINVLRDNGYSVPEDISIVGFDDSGVSTMVSPRLTTIHADFEEMGERAVKRLMEMCFGERDRKMLKISIGSRLVRRETTDVVKKN